MLERTSILERIVLDFAALAFTGGALCCIFFGLGFGFAFCAANLWLGLNFALLAWLLGAATGPQPAPRWFVFALACAKIPVSYLILFWLFGLDYLDPMGLATGLAMLPAVLVFRGLANWRETESKRGAPGDARQGN